jgi:hypothetical protein
MTLRSQHQTPCSSASRAPRWRSACTGLASVDRLVVGWYDGRVVWRVYDDWIPTSGFAEVDASSGELLRIEQGEPDREAPERALPGRLVPTDADLVAFARSKLLAIGWVLPEPVIVTRTSPAAVWRLSSDAAANAIVVEVGGRRGNLHIRRVSRA